MTPFAIFLTKLYCRDTLLLRFLCSTAVVLVSVGIFPTTSRCDRILFNCFVILSLAVLRPHGLRRGRECKEVDLSIGSEKMKEIFASKKEASEWLEWMGAICSLTWSLSLSQSLHFHTKQLQ